MFRRQKGFLSQNNPSPLAGYHNSGKNLYYSTSWPGHKSLKFRVLSPMHNSGPGYNAVCFFMKSMARVMTREHCNSLTSFDNTLIV